VICLIPLFIVPADATEHTPKARELACKKTIDEDNSLTYAEKVVAKNECKTKSLSGPTTNSQDCLAELGISFQKQNTDLYIVNHWPFAAGWFIEGYENVNLIIVGDIVNLSEYPLTNIVISIKTFKDGKILEDTTSWHPIKKILRPGESSPFAIVPPLAAFDSYEIWVSDYEFSCIEVIEPRSMIEDIILDVDSSGRETITLICNPTVPTRDLYDIHIFLASYNEDNYMDYLEIGPFFIFDSYDCLTNGSVSGTFVSYESESLIGIVPFPVLLDYVKEERFELFVIEGPKSIVFNERDVKLQIIQPQKTAYSKYYPDSLRPKHMNIEEIRMMSQQDGAMRWSWNNQVESDISTQSEEKVPGWIKNNAKWWSEGSIGDSDFVSGIQFMIKEKIINIPDLPEQASETAQEKVPDWIRNNAKWWADGLISEDDFVNGIKWLVENGVIRT